MEEISFGKRLLKLRAKNHLTQKQVAQHLQVTPQAYSQYERDQRRPEYEMLIQLAELYKVSLEYLLTGKESAAKRKEMGVSEAKKLPPEAQKELREYIVYLRHKYSDQLESSDETDL